MHRLGLFIVASSMALAVKSQAEKVLVTVTCDNCITTKETVRGVQVHGSLQWTQTLEKGESVGLWAAHKGLASGSEMKISATIYGEGFQVTVFQIGDTEVFLPITNSQHVILEP